MTMMRDGSPRLGVIGAGRMGAGIAATAVAHGLDVTLIHRSAGSAVKAEARVEAAVAAVAGEQQQRVGTLLLSTDPVTLFGTSWVIEAISEETVQKQRMLRQLSDVLDAGTVVASTTSSLSIAELATAFARPERFIGAHFFAPAERMRLVEIIVAPETGDSTLASIEQLARRLGKSTIIARDAPGFYSSRVYSRWMLEGLRCFMDGASISAIDDAAHDAGFAVGPLTALDHAGMELTVAASIDRVAAALMEDRLPILDLRQLLMRAIAGGFSGRAAGAGCYLYERGRRQTVNPGFAKLRGIPSRVRGVGPEEIRERLLLAFVSEALLCLDERVIDEPHDGDLAAVAGLGFPRGLGGPFHWVDEVGSATALARLQTAGASFPTGSTLQHLARAGRRLSTSRQHRPSSVDDEFKPREQSRPG